MLSNIKVLIESWGADVAIYALLGGLLPALIWLTFWLREDSKNPEPRAIILRTFLFGMVAVLLVIPIQKKIDVLLPGMTFATILLWVAAEEVIKLVAAYFGGLHSVEDNEPEDPMVYMIIAALGFSALENSLFLFEPFRTNEVAMGLVTGNLRFIGASLLHVVSSAMVGYSLAVTFYKSRVSKIWHTSAVLILAIVFHTVFNLVIIHLGEPGIMVSFALVWIAVIVLLWGFERAKAIAR